MAQQIQVAKVTTVKVDTGDGSGLQTLGQALDMPETRDQSFMHDVPGDSHGGPQGPPIDIQFLGRIVHVRCELSKFDKTVADQIRARLAANTEALKGTVQTADIGTLMIQDAKYMRVLLSNTNDPMNFPICIVRNPIEIAHGTKFSSIVLEFEAHRNQTTGVIYNTLNS